MYREDAIYTRQSAFREDSISIESQIEFCQFETKGSPHRIYIDKGYSGKNMERPKFLEMMAAIKRNEIKRVICYKLDRCSRSVLDFVSMMEVLQEHNVEFVSCTEKFDTSTPTGRSMLNICIIFAQLERETIQLRCLDAYNSMARKGFYLGGKRPYGFGLEPYCIDGKHTSRYIKRDDEAEILRFIYQHFSQPKVSAGDVVRALVSKGIKNPSSKDGSWTDGRIRSLLISPIYVQADISIYQFFKESGVIIHNPPEDFIGTNGCYLYEDKDSSRKSIRLEGHHLVIAPHKGIIPADIWLRCRKKIQYTGNEKRKNQVSVTWLAGKLKCGKCGYALTPRSTHKRQYTFYLCSREASAGHYCDGVGRHKLVELEEIVLMEMRRKANEIPTLLHSESSQADQQLDEIRAELELTQREIDGLLSKISSANTVLEKYINKRISQLDLRVNELKQQQHERKQQLATQENKKHTIKGWMAHLEELSFEDMRKVLDVMVSRIEVLNEKISISWNF